MLNKHAREVKLGIKNLMLHKLRSLLTMLGVVFGVGSVIAMLAVGEGASKQALDQLERLGSHNIMINAAKPVDEATAMNQRVQMSIYGLLYDDEARIAQFPFVKRTVPVKIVTKEGRLGPQALDLRIVGTTPEWFELVKRRRVGRVLTQIDLDSFSNVVVLTEFGARKLLATQHTIGQQLRLGGDVYEVVGIVQSEQGQSGAGQMPDQEVDAYIPINVARQRYGDMFTQVQSGSFTREQVELHQIIVEVMNDDQVRMAEAAIRAMLVQFHPKQDYKLNVPLTLLENAKATKRTFNVVLGSIAGISLLVGGIGIMNIMLASVTERTREIGIRRAIGAKKRQIVVQFLIETVVLSTVGGFIGIVIGVLIPYLVTVFAKMPTVVTPWSLILSLGISMGVGIIFGIYPAMRAASLDPIVALRHE